MKMKKYVKLAVKIMFHNRLFWLLIVIIALSTSFLGIISTVSQNMSDAAYREQCRIFGNFQYIAYVDGNRLGTKEFETDFVKELYSDKEIKTTGYMYKLGYTVIDGINVNFGYLDPEAWKLSNANMKQGRLPVDVDEVALSDTKLMELASGHPYSIGDNIVINGREFCLTGIYEEFGARWAGAESFRVYLAIDGLFSATDTEYIWNQNASKILTILMEGTNVFNDEEMQDAKNIYSNVYISEEYATNTYQLPGFLIPTISLMIFFLIVSIYLLIGKQRNEVEQIYLQLGLDKKDLRSIQFLTFSFCNIIGFLLGIIGSFSVTAIILNSAKLEIPLQDIHLSKTIFVIFALYLQFVTFLYLVFGSRFGFHLRKRTKKKKFTALSLICTKFFWGFIGLCTFTILIEYSITSFYQRKYELNNLPNYSGEMDALQDTSYDFELRAIDTASKNPENDITTNTLPDDGSGIYLYQNYMYFGITEDTIKRFNHLDGVSYTNAYKENDSAMIHITGDQVNDYIDACDFTLDGKFSPRLQFSWEKIILEEFGLGDKLLVNSKILGCFENDLSALEKNVSEGHINMDQLIQGEEIVLVIPRFKLETLSNGGILMKRMLPGDIIDNSYYKDDSFSVGDTIDFYALQPNNMDLSFGAIPGNKVSEMFHLVQCNVKIGAIIYDYTGRFTNDRFTKPYTIITHNDAFSNFHLNDTFTRLRIYASDETNEEDITRLIFSNYKDITPSMEINNQLRSVRIHRDYLHFLQSIKNVFTLLTAIAFSSILCIYIILQVSYHQRTIGLLFLNGLTLKKLMTALSISICKVWCGTMVLFYITLAFLSDRQWGNIVWSINGNICLLGVLLLILLEIALIPCVWLIKKKSIIQLLK